MQVEHLGRHAVTLVAHYALMSVMGTHTGGNAGGSAGAKAPVAAHWRRIESWLSAHAPPARSALNPAATGEVVANIERAVGGPLPPDFRASLAIHDGQGATSSVFGRWELLDGASIIRHWNLMRRLDQELGLAKMPGQPEGPVRAVWWDSCWIPIASDEVGNDLCLDLNPPPEGTRGQVVEYMHDHVLRPVVSPSFGEWLCAFADELETGHYQIDRISGFPVARPEP